MRLTFSSILCLYSVISVSILLTSIWILCVIGCLSPHCLVLFLEFWSVLSFGLYFFVSVYLLHLWGRALGICQVGATHLAALWCCMWKRVWEGTMPLVQLSASFQSLLPLPTGNWALLVLNSRWVVLCTFWDPVGLSKELSCEAGSFSWCCNTHRFLQPEVLRLYFPSCSS